MKSEKLINKNRKRINYIKNIDFATKNLFLIFFQNFVTILKITFSKKNLVIVSSIMPKIIQYDEETCSKVVSKIRNFHVHF